MISDTSGAVLLEGDEIIRKPALLDGWPARHTSFDEARLIQRIQEELMSDGQWPLNIDKKRALEARGYHSNTTEQIIEATKSDSYYVRKMALELLTERIGIDAIGKLKAALDDSALLVRCTAAHLLATFGDRSGLAQMQRDFVELAPELEQAMINDPSFNKDWANIKVRNKTFSIEDGLEVSKVLAELGDPSGYELAETALKGFSRGLRLRAINILVEIAKTQEAGCSVRVLDPISILTKVAASEKEEDVILALFNLTTMRLKSSTAARVLEAAMNAPDQTEHVRQVAQKFLDELACSTQLSNN